MPYDICVVGGGALGLYLARLLGERGVRTLLLESGPDGVDAEQQALAEVEAGGLPFRTDVTSFPRRLGGATKEWGGRCLQHSAIDFESRSWIAHSGWPIDLDDLTDHYAAAEDALGVAPLGPPDDTATTIREHGDFDVGDFRWSAFTDCAAQWRSVVESLPTVDLALEATVVGLAIDDERVVGLDVAVRDGKLVRVHAHRFVIAAGGIENVRLLLHARQSGARGLGGPQLGRRVMEHPKTEGTDGRIVASSRFPAGWFARFDRGAGLTQPFIRPTDAQQYEYELLNHAIYVDVDFASWESPAYLAMRDLRDPAVGVATRLRAGVQLATRPLGALRYLQQHRSGDLGEASDIRIVNQLSQPPDGGSSIRLGERRDRHGVPIPVFDWKVGDQEIESLEWMHQRLDALLRAKGWGHLESSPLAGEAESMPWANASHPMGGTRMSTSASEGVVDPQLRVHGVRNLYVTGVSVLPTGGFANPTFTAFALTHRLFEALLADR